MRRPTTRTGWIGSVSDATLDHLAHRLRPHLSDAVALVRDDEAVKAVSGVPVRVDEETPVHRRCTFGDTDWFTD